MELGVTVPIVELGADLSAVRDFVQAAEGLGYTHVRILDHVTPWPVSPWCYTPIDGGRVPAAIVFLSGALPSSGAPPDPA